MGINLQYYVDYRFLSYCAYRVELPTEKRVRKWGISLDNLMTDPLGNDFKQLSL